MGDAAHATLQSLAQGAGMAMEDAVILGALIDRHRDDLPAAFPAFEKARIVRTARVQLESRAMWERFYHTGGVEAEVRNAIEAERSHEDVWQCLDWLYRGAEVPGAPAGA